MAVTYIRDPSFKIIGQLLDTAHGQLLIDQNGKMLGKYNDVGVKSTIDMHGNLVGQGNVLLMLLKK